jgi:hypothetical protein
VAEHLPRPHPAVAQPAPRRRSRLSTVCRSLSVCSSSSRPRSLITASNRVLVVSRSEERPQPVAGSPSSGGFRPGHCLPIHDRPRGFPCTRDTPQWIGRQPTSSAVESRSTTAGCSHFDGSGFDPARSEDLDPPRSRIAKVPVSTHDDGYGQHWSAPPWQARLRAGVRVGTTIVLDTDDPKSGLIAGDKRRRRRDHTGRRGRRVGPRVPAQHRPADHAVPRTRSGVGARARAAAGAPQPALSAAARARARRLPVGAVLALVGTMPNAAASSASSPDRVCLRRGGRIRRAARELCPTGFGFGLVASVGFAFAVFFAFLAATFLGEATTFVAAFAPPIRAPKSIVITQAARRRTCRPRWTRAPSRSRPRAIPDRACSAVRR